MPSGPVIPDSHVILVPLEADLRVVVLCHELRDISDCLLVRDTHHLH